MTDLTDTEDLVERLRAAASVLDMLGYVSDALTVLGTIDAIETLTKERDEALQELVSWTGMANVAKHIARLKAAEAQVSTLTAEIERLGLVETIEFDADDGRVSKWINVRAEAAEQQLAEARKALEGARAAGWAKGLEDAAAILDRGYDVFEDENARDACLVASKEVRALAALPPETTP
jgi:hypothetical protein